MRWIMAVALLGVAGCATQDVEPPSGKARFSAYPDTLFSAFESACEGPAQTFSRPETGVVECREFLPPEPTAAIILNFNGTMEKLPQLVIRFRTEANAPGYVVENDVFLTVPQKTGGPIEVRQNDNRLLRRLETLYLRAGGVPE